MAENKYCTHCGQEIPAEARYCPYCATQVTMDAGNEARTTTAPPPLREEPKAGEQGKKLNGTAIALMGVLGAVVIAIVVVLILNGQQHKGVTFQMADTAYDESEVAEAEVEEMIVPVELHLDGYERATYDGWTYNFSGSGIARTNNGTGERQKIEEFVDTYKAWVIGDYLLVSGSTGDWGNCLRVNLNGFREVEYFGCGADVQGTTVVLHYQENVGDDIWTQYDIHLNCEDFMNHSAVTINNMPHQKERRYKAANHWGDEYDEDVYGEEE